LFWNCVLVHRLRIIDDSISTDVVLASKVELVKSDNSLEGDIDSCFLFGLSNGCLLMRLMNLGPASRNPPFPVAFKDA
jgi:hypothetical protein